MGVEIQSDRIFGGEGRGLSNVSMESTKKYKYVLLKTIRTAQRNYRLWGEGVHNRRDLETSEMDAQQNISLPLNWWARIFNQRKGDDLPNE